MVVAVGVSTHSVSWMRVGGQLEEQVDCRGVQEPLLFPEQMHLITNLLPDSDREIEANEQKTTVSLTKTVSKPVRVGSLQDVKYVCIDITALLPSF